MNGKGMKRRLPRTGGPPSESQGHGGDNSGCLRRNRITRHRKKNQGGQPYCCRCQQWKGSSIRLASILGIHVLGLVVCPCRGFAPALARVGLAPDRHGSIYREVVDHSSSIVSVDSSCLRKDAAACGAGARGREGRRRPKDRKSNAWTSDGGSGSGYATSVCQAKRLPNAEEERPLGLLYDGTLLEAGVATAETSASRNGYVAGVGKATTTAKADKSKTAAAATPVVEADSLGNSLPATENKAANLTTSQWPKVMDVAIANATPVTRQQDQDQKQAPTPSQEQSTTKEATPGVRLKWSGKGWLGIGASWRAGEGWKGPHGTEVVTAPSVESSKTTIPPEAGVNGIFQAVGVDRSNASGHISNLAANVSSSGLWGGGGAYEGNAQEVALSLTSTLCLEEKPSWRVWQGTRQARVTESPKEQDVHATAREELTVYLLETGAKHYDVSMASAALFAMEPELALTEATWWRWRQNLDGLRSKGFSGSNVANMLALCPQLLGLDFEAQVLPTMSLLRDQLGMRPTDARRVIRKAPEILAPRADGSTAQEAADVLRVLGIQTRQLRMEALRWPQLLTVPSGSYFQLAAFLASEEVGIRATDIGSLVRQAPWLALQSIDGQMLPVVRFLRRAGVVELERVLRAYPKVLCDSIKDDLAPRVRFLWQDVGVSEEDLPKVLQTFPLLFAVPLSRMEDLVSFLSEDLTINRKDIAKIVRAFPSLLGLERELHMTGVVQYLKKLGVQNVGRFVSRLPPVLGYDVNTNLIPKMSYLVEVMGLSVYDVLTFPAYFSYPLENVIEPRTEFLFIRGRPITLVGLNIALQQGDADFARKVAKVQPKVYQEFKEAYTANREVVKSGKANAESILSKSQRKAIGNLGGLSTNNNMSARVYQPETSKEVKARATSVPPSEPNKPKTRR